MYCPWSIPIIVDCADCCCCGDFLLRLRCGFPFIDDDEDADDEEDDDGDDSIEVDDIWHM